MSPAHVSLSVYTQNTSIGTLLSAAHSMGSAQSVPPNGTASVCLMTSSSRVRGENETGAMPHPYRAHRDLYEPALNATISCAGSTAAVTSAIAALPTRGVIPGMPAITGDVIDPDTSRASSVRAPVGVTVSNDR